MNIKPIHRTSCHCGIYTHHQQRPDPGLLGFNVGCLEDIDAFLLGDVPVHDGINHPADQNRNGE